MAIVTLGGMGDMTPAMQNIIRKAAGGTARARSKKRKKASSSRKKKVAAKPVSKRASKRPARLVKGSAAAKRYMASIRAKRK